MKRRFMFPLHGAMSQKMEIFIITSLRTSNPTATKWFFKSAYSNVTSMQWMSVKPTEIFKIVKNILDKYVSAIGVAFLFLVGRGRCWKVHNAEVRTKTDPMIRDCRVTGLLAERSDWDSLQGTRHPSILLVRTKMCPKIDSRILFIIWRFISLTLGIYIFILYILYIFIFYIVYIVATHISTRSVLYNVHLRMARSAETCCEMGR
jgi:hypothetical protein